MELSRDRGGCTSAVEEDGFVLVLAETLRNWINYIQIKTTKIKFCFRKEEMFTSYSFFRYSSTVN